MGSDNKSCKDKPLNVAEVLFRIVPASLKVSDGSGVKGSTISITTSTVLVSAWAGIERVEKKSTRKDKETITFLIFPTS